MKQEKFLEKQGRNWKLPKKSLARQKERLLASGRLLSLPTVVNIVTIALFFTSCGAQKTSSIQEVRINQHARDSLLREVRSVEVVTIPRSEVTLNLPIDTIRKLPERSMYYSRSGQASVEVQFVNDTITITAVCDSLQGRLEYYEIKLAEYEASNEMYKDYTEELKKTRPKILQSILLAFFSGILIGIILTIKIKQKLK